MHDCEWYFVYDIIEEIYRELSNSLDFSNHEEYFEEELNRYFRDRGIGWQLFEGRIEVRGPEIFEESVQGALYILEETERLNFRRQFLIFLDDLNRI